NRRDFYVTIGVDEVLIFGHGSAAGCGLGKKAEFGPPNNNYEQSCEENGRDCADSQHSRFVHWVLTVVYMCADSNIAGRGLEGTDDKGKLATGGISAEAQAALANIERVVKSAGFELKDIVSVTVYLADIHEFGDMNKVYKSIMPDPKPARATVQVAALVNNAR